MLKRRTSSRHSVTSGLWGLLRAVPWWIVIVAIVGLVVAYAVLTDVRYLDAIYFLFDFPWHKEVLAEIPVQGESWTFNPGPQAPLAARRYRIYAEFDSVTATTGEDTPLYAEPDATSAVAAELKEGTEVKFVRWHVIPAAGARMEQRWVYAATDDGLAGWALIRQFGRLSYEPAAQSGMYTIQIDKGAVPGEGPVIDTPADEAVQVQTTTPTIQGPVVEGSVVRIYEKYNLGQTLARAWLSKGVVLTLRATIIGYSLALVLGLLAGLMLVSRNPITLAIAKLYVEVIRGIPLLVIILYTGFVLSPYLREATGGRIDLRGFLGAVIGLGFGYGAYLAEVFRAGIQSIHSGQMEAARSLGMGYFQSMRYIILPQALRVVLPPLGNDFIAMLKDSSLISVVALPEILQQGRLWVSRTFRAFEGYNTVALFYLVMTLLLSLIVRLIEHKTALPGRSSEE